MTPIGSKRHIFLDVFKVTPEQKDENIMSINPCTGECNPNSENMILFITL